MEAESYQQNPSGPLSEAEIAAQLDEEQLQRNAKPFGSSILTLVVLGAVSLPMLFIGFIKAGNYYNEQQKAQFEAEQKALVANAKPIVWYTDFNAAMQQATTEKKSIMINFYTDWCPVCKRMDAEVLNTPYIMNEAEKIIPVRLNAEEQTVVAQKYNISKYPTYVWTDSAGNEKYRQIGGSSTKEFWDTMRQYK